LFAYALTSYSHRAVLPITPYAVGGYRFAEIEPDGTRHLGEDVSPPAGVGTPVKAVADGTIIISQEYVSGYGQLVVISHSSPSPYVSIYGHLSRQAQYPLRSPGNVNEGDIIGYVGSQDENGGWAPHLHFAVYKNAPDGQYHYWGVAPNKTGDDVDFDAQGNYVGGLFTKPSTFVQQLAAPPAWTHVTISGGPATGQPDKPVYDPATNRLIVFGGNGNGPCCSALNQVWVVRNANGIGGTPYWQQLQPLGDPNSNPPYPQPRTGHSTVYDQANNRLIVFGGGQTNSFAFAVRFNDVWVLQNANGVGTPQWQQITPASGPAPAARERQKAVYDPATNHMIIFGGGNNGIMDVPADVWVLTNANGIGIGGPSQWIQTVPEGGNAPVRRQGFGTGYDPATNRMMVFGGCCFQLGDLWVLSNANTTGATWQRIAQASPTPGARSDFASGYDPRTNRFLVIGGINSNRTAELNDFWVLSGANDIGTLTWVNTITNNHAGSPPAVNPTGIYDPGQNEFFAFATTNDLWLLTNANSLTPVQ
jgi:hypothetical protein